MPKFEFCIPTVSKAVPAGAKWFHEVKYDGYRLHWSGMTIGFA
jgi:ATP-dependent DNA ligase